MLGSAISLVGFGFVAYWFFVFLEYSPLWFVLVMTEHPLFGSNAFYKQWTLAAAGLAAASVAASAAEMLAPLSHLGWKWPYRRLRVGKRSCTYVFLLLCLLGVGSVAYWYLYQVVPQLQRIYGPPPPPYGSYSYEPPEPSSGSYGYEPSEPSNGSSYDSSRTDVEDATVTDETRRRLQHGMGAKWTEALSTASRQAGSVSMIPISLLGVPLSRSSALWRMVGLSYEEAVSFHRMLGVLALLLVTFHALGYFVLWIHGGELLDNLFSSWGVGGLNPWCTEACEGVSNLAGLIAWGAGLLMWATSIECMRRRFYFLFLQMHQMHYVWFAMTAAHWSTSNMFILPSAVFYAADLVLRAYGTHACPEATLRTHGGSSDADPAMVTLLLPIAEAADASSARGSGSGGSCPYLQRLERMADESQHGTTSQPDRDPWAGSTVHLRLPSLSCWWAHPFTVAGSVALDVSEAQRTRCSHALLVHIAPYERWTRRLARLGARLEAEAPSGVAHLPRLALTGPLPAPPHLEHLASEVLAGRPLLLIGAGSGVTPGVSLIRMLASRTLPSHARVRFVVLVRSIHWVEALDGYMLPRHPDGATGLHWLTTEIHATRKVALQPPATTSLHADTTSEEAGITLPAVPPLASSQTPPLPSNGGHEPGGLQPLPSPSWTHSFRGTFRMVPTGSVLKAVAAPYSLAGAAKLPPLVSGAGELVEAPTEIAHPVALRLGRSAPADEMATITGALAGFLGTSWPLLWSSEAAPLSGHPTIISGTAALTIAWLGALAGAFAALVASDLIARTLMGRVGGTRNEASSDTASEASSFDAATSPTSPAPSGGMNSIPEGIEPSFTQSAEELAVELACNGARPKWPEKVDTFLAETASVAASSAGKAVPEVLVAAGGPSMLIEELKQAVPAHVTLSGLTFPM